MSKLLARIIAIPFAGVCILSDYYHCILNDIYLPKNWRKMNLEEYGRAHPIPAWVIVLSVPVDILSGMLIVPAIVLGFSWEEFYRAVDFWQFQFWKGG